MRFAGDCFRAHDPRWSFAPLSGEGAAVHGGRFNPAGVPALYLSLTMEGAAIEAAQGFAGKLEPLTICLYAVDCADVVDASSETACAHAGIDPAEISSPWALDRAEGREPASWALARRLSGAGHCGMLYPSFARGARPGMLNLVLWHWGAVPPCKVNVFDPSGRLPKNQLSWS